MISFKQIRQRTKICLGNRIRPAALFCVFYYEMLRGDTPSYKLGYAALRCTRSNS